MTVEVQDAGAEILNFPTPSLQRKPVGLLARCRRPDDPAGRTPNLNKSSIWRELALRTDPCSVRNNQGRHARASSGTLGNAHGATAKKKRKDQCCVESWHMSLTLELSGGEAVRLERVVRRHCMFLNLVSPHSCCPSLRSARKLEHLPSPLPAKPPSG
jgi:hypothetical protein